VGELRTILEIKWLYFILNVAMAVEVWKQVLQILKAQIVIGARSALFLPFADLGFVT
jgi:primosomal protein N' (replication factor Y)